MRRPPVQFASSTLRFVLLVVVSGFFLSDSFSSYCTALSTNDYSRRHVLERAARGLVVAGLPQISTRLGNQEAAIAEESSAALPAKPTIVAKDKTVLILGANGQTGRECVKAVLASGRPCVATTRSGNFDVDSLLLSDNDDSTTTTTATKLDKRLLTTGPLDVTKAEEMRSVMANTPNLGAVIFAASASTKGGNAFDVDKNGVIYAAQACIACQIPRLVIISSGTVTRPDSAVYKLLNTVGKGIMEAKIQGEDQVRALYAEPNVLLQGLGYTVVRPGGLTTGESLGASALELNQGDNKSGRLSRADVAEICVHALDSTSTFDVTFECYERLTAKPIESVGFSNILKLKGESTFVSGKERQGSDWKSLFDGLETDVGFTA